MQQAFMDTSQQSKLEMSFVEGVLGVQLPSGRSSCDDI